MDFGKYLIDWATKSGRVVHDSKRQDGQHVLTRRVETILKFPEEGYYANEREVKHLAT